MTRYSMKIEFDHYNKDLNYYGLDKMSLDCSFQDNSYLKNYMTYQMMSFMEVPSSLCSYTWVTINDKDWGFFSD
ncbi:CotH kinase family protein [Coprobacillaceae bacterium CR2/5/TPMF4]|nr:CotH kinase family protein [Coprobacillaceae bacterium CR2/5/TPMF4]